MANIQPKATEFPILSQKDALLDLSAKYAHDSDLEAISVYTNYTLSPAPFIAPTKDNLKTAISTNTLDHPTKCICLAKSIDKYSSQVCDSLISNSLASHIRERMLWKEETNTVSLGSSPLEELEHNVDTFPITLDNMSIDNIFFANNGIRCTAQSSECELTAETPAVLTYLTLALKCSSVFCKTLYVLPNAQINVCKHRLVYSSC